MMPVFSLIIIILMIYFLSKIFGKQKYDKGRKYNYDASHEYGKTLKSPARSIEEHIPLTRKHAKAEIDKLLNVKKKTKIIIFDIETNGSTGNYSVLSCSAIKYEIDPKTYEIAEIGRFNRYYFPVEQFNPSIITINGLTKEVLMERRKETNYPEYFHIDPDFETFCLDTKRFIAHNVLFDSQFVPFIKNKKKLCTMKTNTDIVATEYMQWKKEWKWPNLSETANYYGIEFSKIDLHDSMLDTEITARIFMKMLDAAKT
jgi:DNA polymerase III subunit epsilon